MGCASANNSLNQVFRGHDSDIRAMIAVLSTTEVVEHLDFRLDGLGVRLRWHPNPAHVWAWLDVIFASVKAIRTDTAPPKNEKGGSGGSCESGACPCDSCVEERAAVAHHQH